ncbi:MAG TPA: DEAD/DEAH box helicase [Candidatus Limnocylindrales bacterium]|nr:DEAD/DEAH box helicase [Candidatus Limnocylindrales bacterium]
MTDSLPPDRDAEAAPHGHASDDAESPAPGFAALGLDDRLLQTLADLGYEEPTPIQLAAIPPLLRGTDLLAEAPTGTGKTAAFALPILQRLAARLDEGRAAGRSVEGRGAGADGRGARPTALVLAPTRELAMQVAEAIHRYGKRLGVRVVPVYGGQPITTQLHRLGRGVDVVVATPGRAVDHLDRGTLRFDEVETVVLDEADEMLDMGFADDLERILGSLREMRQTALFSATIAGPIARLAERHLRHPARVQVEAEAAAAGEPARVRQVAYVVRRPDKLTALGRILDLEDGAATLVFARTRGEVDDLAEALSGRGRDAAALHGGLSQEQRDRIMSRFRDGALDVLVATDVAARGLDIEHITHVVNYDVPSSPDTYVHRIGRTGRAGREGVAITLVEPREHRLVRDIERTIGQPLAIEGLPTVADVREHRLDLLIGTLREVLVAGDTDRYRGVVEALAQEYDAVEIALAAVSLADAEARGAEDTTELAPAWLPDPSKSRATNGRDARGARAPGGRGPARVPASHGSRQPRALREAESGGGSPDGEPTRRATSGPGAGRQPQPAGPRRGYRASGWKDADGRPIMRPPRAGSGGPGGVTRVFVGAGRAAGMRPGDLVGAITNEAGLRGGDIGAIQIADGFSLVEVPEAAADHVIRTLRGATIRGQKVTVRRERY